jgi:hypothetical protein
MTQVAMLWPGVRPIPTGLAKHRAGRKRLTIDSLKNAQIGTIAASRIFGTSILGAIDGIAQLREGLISIPTPLVEDGLSFTERRSECAICTL